MTAWIVTHLLPLAVLTAQAPEGGADREIPVYKVSAFSRSAFQGNPAAVCLLEKWPSDELMRHIAAELNSVSETAFVVPSGQSGDRFSLRWFSPEVEVPMCGHATLATAKVLFDALRVKATELTFDTKSGPLTARKEGAAIALRFPGETPVLCPPPQALLAAMGIREGVETLYAKERKKLVVRLASAERVRALRPDFKRMLAAKSDADIRGVVVTARGEAPYDIVSRYFAPWVGVDEDPVTGSAHTVLGPYWSRVLGKRTLRAYQASKRGGELTVRVEEDGRVTLLGEAVLVFEGKLELPAEETLP